MAVNHVKVVQGTRALGNETRNADVSAKEVRESKPWTPPTGEQVLSQLINSDNPNASLVEKMVESLPVGAGPILGLLAKIAAAGSKAGGLKVGFAAVAKLKLGDVAALLKKEGMVTSRPGGGSTHVKYTHPNTGKHVTLPFHGKKNETLPYLVAEQVVRFLKEHGIKF